MRKSVGQAPTAGKQTQQKPCRTFSNIEAEQENHRTRFDVGSERVNLESRGGECLTSDSGNKPEISFFKVYGHLKWEQEMDCQVTQELGNYFSHCSHTSDVKASITKLKWHTYP
jgi:hypothetical protein